MKLISFLLLFLLMEMHNARQKTTPNVIRIPLSKTRKRMNSANARSIILEDIGNSVGRISIGKPKQDLMVWFDTGSTVLWVFSNKYDTCEPNFETVIKKQNLYDHEASSSFQPSLNRLKEPRPQLIVYGIGWVFGFKANDVITMEGKEIRRDFLEVTKTTKHRAEQGSNGFVGLRYHPTKGNIASILCDEMKAEQKFSYYLPKVFNQKHDGKGELLFCGEDQTKYIEGTMKYINETDPGTWYIPLDSVTMEESKTTTVIASKNIVLIDSGSNRIFGPEADLKNFLDSLKPYLIGDTPYQEVHCNRIHLFPKMIFTIDGTNFTFIGRDYTMKVGKNCFVLINPRKVNPRWTFGEPFLRKYYTVFDMKNHKIGIAQSKG